MITNKYMLKLKYQVVNKLKRFKIVNIVDITVKINICGCLI